VTYPIVRFVSAPRRGRGRAVRLQHGGRVVRRRDVARARRVLPRRPALEGDPDAYGVEYGLRQLEFNVIISGAYSDASRQWSQLAKELVTGRRTNWLMFQFSEFSQPVWFKTYRTAPGRTRLRAHRRHRRRGLEPVGPRRATGRGAVRLRRAGHPAGVHGHQRPGRGDEPVHGGPARDPGRRTCTGPLRTHDGHPALDPVADVRGDPGGGLVRSAAGVPVRHGRLGDRVQRPERAGRGCRVLGWLKATGHLRHAHRPRSPGTPVHGRDPAWSVCAAAPGGSEQRDQLHVPGDPEQPRPRCRGPPRPGRGSGRPLRAVGGPRHVHAARWPVRPGQHLHVPDEHRPVRRRARRAPAGSTSTRWS
jgi:hypothetical protein